MAGARGQSTGLSGGPGLPGSRGPLERRLEPREGRWRVRLGSCSLLLPPGDSSPPPSPGCFTPILLFPLLSPCPRLRGRRGLGGGFRWLAVFVAFQNPRLSLAHLSFSFTTFSALGPGCISRKIFTKGRQERSPGTAASVLTPTLPSPSCCL